MKPNQYLILTILLLPFESNQEFCSDTISTGPFNLQNKPFIPVPAKKDLQLVEVNYLSSDAEIILGYRSYWKSYCYQGGALDPNTGCENNMINLVPKLEEIEEWYHKGMCKIGKECKNCWGSDAQACFDVLKETVWVKNKEISHRTNNNNFAHHTCNLEWRCGLTINKWTTYLQYQQGKYEIYTTSKNGTKLRIYNKFLLEESDHFLYVENTPDVLKMKKNVTCFKGKHLECFDNELGYYLNFETNNPVCREKHCYLYKSDLKENLNNENKLFFGAAGINDVKRLLDQELINNEAIRYNMANMIVELNDIKEKFSILVNSIAKIDDRLIGNILKHPSRTKYITEKEFLMSPCQPHDTKGSNCNEDYYYNEGRWLKKKSADTCLRVKTSKPIDIFNEETFWLPTLSEITFKGDLTKNEGWTFLAQEKDNLKQTMEYTKYGGKGTAIEDVAALPMGALLGKISALFVNSGIIWIILILFIVKFLCNRTKWEGFGR